MKGTRAWHIVALLVAILAIKAVLCWPNGLLFTLFGLHDVYGYATSMWLGTASWAAAFAIWLHRARAYNMNITLIRNDADCIAEADS